MKEQEIRPRKFFDEYLRLAAIDSEVYFGNSSLQEVACPGCGVQGEYSFVKHGFQYKECPICQTLFVSPRPPIEDFFHYYQESPSARYLATTFYQETAEVRREKLWLTKAKMINHAITRYVDDNYSLIDIGGGHGIFAEEYWKRYGHSVVVIEPNPDMAKVCRSRDLEVIELFLEQVSLKYLPSGHKVFVSFELFEHLHDCKVFLTHLRSLMSSGDMFMFTTLSGTGIDIQVLWDYSNSISLQHLNFLNPKSIRLLAESIGLNVLSIETPGKLDMDILFNNLSLVKDRFWHNLLKRSSEEDLRVWQEFIVSRGLSSHMFVVCKCQ